MVRQKDPMYRVIVLEDHEISTWCKFLDAQKIFKLDYPSCRSSDAGGDVARGRGLVGVGADGEDAAGHRGEHPQRHLRLLGRHRRKRDISRPSESCTVVQSGNAGFD